MQKSRRSNRRLISMLLSVGDELVRELSELRFTLGVEGGFDPNRCFKNGDIFARRFNAIK